MTREQFKLGDRLLIRHGATGYLFECTVEEIVDVGVRLSSSLLKHASSTWYAWDDFTLIDWALVEVLSDKSSGHKWNGEYEFDCASMSIVEGKMAGECRPDFVNHYRVKREAEEIL